MKKTIFSLSFLIVTVLSCKNEGASPDSCIVDVASVSGSYKITAIKYKPGSSAPEQDYFALLDACEKDDIVKLNANGVADYQDVGTVCTPDGNYTSTWSLSGNTINIDGTAGNIDLFDCNKLVVSASGAIIPGDIFTITYEKQ